MAVIMYARFLTTFFHVYDQSAALQETILYTFNSNVKENKVKVTCSMKFNHACVFSSMPFL